MKRAKLGDIYYIKLPNGYKIYQWAYTHHRRGEYIRVFDGLYQNIPDNIDEIVSGPHSYVLAFDTKRSYRLGLSVLIGNYPVPEEYPMSKISVEFGPTRDKKWAFYYTVIETCDWFRKEVVSCFEDLPNELKSITTLEPFYSPARIFYIFDAGFDFYHLDRFDPEPIDGDTDLPYKPYFDMIEEAFKKDREKRALRKKEIEIEKAKKNKK